MICRWSDRVTGENGRSSVRRGVAPDGLTISELSARYWSYAQAHYRQDAQPTKDVGNIKDALRPLRKRYGSTVAASF